MEPILPPDIHYLEATLGWLMLGNATEARAEFGQLSADSRRHPQVLDAEWRLLAEERRWSEALQVAEKHLAAAPDNPGPWIHRAYALHELKRTSEAWERLLPATEKFPDEPTIPYNLACYACQLGNFPAARRWLKKAFQIEADDTQRQRRRAMALADPDLQPLWEEIRRQLER